MSAEHEKSYAKLVDTFARNVREERFSEEAVPGLVNQMRAELGQCIELGLITSRFYAERMDILARVLDTVGAL